MESKVLGILGGLGPAATVYFYDLLTQHTKVNSDQDHLDIIISSKATTPDRTAYILDNSKANPLPVMLNEAKKLIQAGAEIIALPCNTAHTLYEQLSENISVPLLNMVGDTVKVALAAGFQKVGILATEGTVFSGVYQNTCKENQLEYALPSLKAQQLVTSMIYDDIKRGKMPSRAQFEDVCTPLFNEGCDALILACTELSLLKREFALDHRFIDSLEVLAEKSIRACGKVPVGFAERKVV